MPTYEYKCCDCPNRFEVFQKMTEEHLKHCPKCKGKVRRLVGTGSGVIENNYDQSGIIWPFSVAPFHLLILPINYEEPTVNEAANRLYAAAQEKRIPVLIDDRDRQAGEKFKDADLIGIPFRVTIGKNLKKGKVELKKRSEPKGELFPPDQILKVVSQCLEHQI